MCVDAVVRRFDEEMRAPGWVYAVSFFLGVVGALGQVVLSFYAFWLVWRVLLPDLPGPPDRDDRIAPGARDEISEAILERAWSDEVRAFTGAFGSDHLDASVLLIPIVGFLPGDDERVIATLDAVERQLGDDALVQRWTGAGDEGAFVICSYWLAAGWALAGQVERAKSIFEKVTGYANDLGLLSEEVHKRDGTLLGNFPQALSHIGLVNAAWTISQAEASEHGQ